MALDKLVDSTQLDSDLTDVADEIRTAGGTLLPLSFPDDYVVAIGDIGNTEIKTASGSIAHFEDALARRAQNLTVAIEPVQDLHGYDNPWPAGGGKNLLTALPSSGTTVWFCEPNGFTFKANQTYCFSVGNDVTVGSYAIYAADKTTQLAYANSNRKVTYTPTVDTVGYPRLYAGEGVSQEAINSAQLELGNSRTTYAPYSNICPISGWTGAKVTRTGKNLYQFPFGFGLALTGSGNNRTVVSRSVNQGSIIKLKPNTQYTLSGTFTDAVDKFNRIGLFTSKPEVGSVSTRFLYASNNSSLTFTTVSNECYALAYTDKDTDASVDCNRQLEEGSTATAYEPYQGETYSITFPASAGTVYGGTIDVTQGKLTVDKGMTVIRGDLGWWSKGYGHANYILLRNIVTGVATAATGPERSAMCKTDLFKPLAKSWSQGFSTDNEVAFSVSTDDYFAFNTGEDIPVVNDWLNENPITFVYPLATPIVYDLDPVTVTTLLGTNNVWADTGDSTIKYIAPKAQIPSAQGVYF